MILFLNYFHIHSRLQLAETSTGDRQQILISASPSPCTLPVDVSCLCNQYKQSCFTKGKSTFSTPSHSRINAPLPYIYDHMPFSCHDAEKHPYTG